MHDIIIVGAGPAGMTAAIYAMRGKKNVLVLEAKTYGGQIVTAADIENYPCEEHISGYDFATKLYNQVKSLGTEIKFEKVIDIKNCDTYKEVITEKSTYKTKTIILATGADNRKLGIEKETELIGKGVSYCATCDGAFYKDKDVAVVGGGNTALEEALYLSTIVKTVYLIHRRDSFRADQKLIDDIKKCDNIKLILNSNVSSLNTDTNGLLESIDIIGSDDNISKLSISGLFIAVGRIPENENFSKIIDVDESGYINALEDCKTNVEGIFVAGDNRKKSLRQLVTATSDGAVAATNAIQYIRNLEA